jgi:hypothetical protein
MLRQEVLNVDREHLGEIVELMLDVDTGMISYAVLSSGGGFMGSGNKLFAVPWQKIVLLKADSEHEGHLDRKFMLDVPKELLKDAPGFDPDNWPDVKDSSWLRDVYIYYGCEPYWY